MLSKADLHSLRRAAARVGSEPTCRVMLNGQGPYPAHCYVTGSVKVWLTPTLTTVTNPDLDRVRVIDGDAQ